jgi:hypothetical protein
VPWSSRPIAGGWEVRHLLIGIALLRQPGTMGTVVPGTSIAFEDDRAYISEPWGREKGNSGTCPTHGGAPMPWGVVSAKHAGCCRAGMYPGEDCRQ